VLFGSKKEGYKDDDNEHDDGDNDEVDKVGKVNGDKNLDDLL